ncbi:HAD family hydrolase [Nocardia camponoti]|uniref:Phosphoglycolate phosphatase n=1 Tax=Nocardia camponoti TaxID=1616106 RepID=A0A917V698_9NOCA|nr:HAD-IA family hydrolase [Nocardia camponoti]GGK43673.1 phosphoglycolate phosphatase [Nocardia camponoti]
MSTDLWGRPLALFDLDGVIIDTRLAIQEALRALSESAGINVDQPSLTAGAELPPVEALALFGVSDPGYVYESGFDAALKLASGKVKVFDGTVRGMVAIAREGAAVGIVTAQARRRLPLLIPPPVAEIVDVVVAYEDAAAKPSPDGILIACARCGVLPSRSLFVGDRPTDVRAGRAAGSLTVGAGWNAADIEALRAERPDVLLTSADQVGAHLLRLIGSQ